MNNNKRDFYLLHVLQKYPILLLMNRKIEKLCYPSSSLSLKYKTPKYKIKHIISNLLISSLFTTIQMDDKKNKIQVEKGRITYIHFLIEMIK